MHNTALAKYQEANLRVSKKDADSQERGIVWHINISIVKPPAILDKTSTIFTQIAKVINDPPNSAATISKASINHLPAV